VAREGGLFTDPGTMDATTVVPSQIARNNCTHWQVSSQARQPRRLRQGWRSNKGKLGLPKPDARASTAGRTGTARTRARALGPRLRPSGPSSASGATSHIGRKQVSRAVAESAAGKTRKGPSAAVVERPTPPTPSGPPSTGSPAGRSWLRPSVGRTHVNRRHGLRQAGADGSDNAGRRRFRPTGESPASDAGVSRASPTAIPELPGPGKNAVSLEAQPGDPIRRGKYTLNRLGPPQS